jgi:hypothetical protein
VAAQKQTSSIVYDALLSFENGINSGISPFRLPKTQCAFAVNTTFRNDYATDRPPFSGIVLTFITPQVMAAFQGGLWQGGCTYLPDAGQTQMICSISGRIFRVTPDDVGGAFIDEITIPGDPNSPSQPQSWLWQAERWVIINNGLNDPIFYDGISCRRSETTSEIIGVTSANFTVPALGSNVVVSLTGPYTGLPDSTIFIGAATYAVQAIGGSGTVNKVTLQALYGGAGTTIPSGSQLVIEPSNLGLVVSATFSVNQWTVTLASPIPRSIPRGNFPLVSTKTQVSIGSGVFPISSISSNGMQFSFIARQTFTGAVPGASVILVQNTQPNLTGGVTSADLIVPSAGGTVDAILTAPYQYADGVIVYYGGVQFQVVSHSSQAGTGNNVTLENLTDIPASTVVSGTDLMSIPELPAGRMGTYGMGRIWECLLDGISFIAGDIVGGSSGSPKYNFREAVLKVTENTFLFEGGSFKVPGAGQQITAMQFVALLDASLGQGPLQVFTKENVFSCNAPVDRATWQSLTNPILSEALIGSGASGQDAVIRVNGDLIFRSPNPNGIRSLLMARLDFNQWGNTPNSREMTRLLSVDNLAGLLFVSGIQFDNRVLMTASPVQGNQGVYFKSMVALNLDPNSSLAGKDASIYDGMWTGLNIFKVMSASFNGNQRSFAFSWNSVSGNIELNELLPTGSGTFDSGTVPIVWSFESPVLFLQVKDKPYFDLLKMQDGEIYVSDLVPASTTHFKVELRPDFSSCWYPWTEFDVCCDSTSNVNQYRTRLGLGRPTEDECNTVEDTPSNIARWFQVRITVTGHCVFQGAKFMASIEPDSEFAQPACET